MPKRCKKGADAYLRMEHLHFKGGLGQNCYGRCLVLFKDVQNPVGYEREEENLNCCDKCCRPRWEILRDQPKEVAQTMCETYPLLRPPNNQNVGNKSCYGTPLSSNRSLIHMKAVVLEFALPLTLKYSLSMSRISTHTFSEKAEHSQITS